MRAGYLIVMLLLLPMVMAPPPAPPPAPVVENNVGYEGPNLTDSSDSDNLSGDAVLNDTVNDTADQFVNNLTIPPVDSQNEDSDVVETEEFDDSSYSDDDLESSFGALKYFVIGFLCLVILLIVLFLYYFFKAKKIVLTARSLGFDDDSIKQVLKEKKIPSFFIKFT